MGALADLWKSERGLVGCVLIAAVTVLAALGKITYDQWLDQTKVIFYVYVGSKTITGAVQLAKAGPAGSNSDVPVLPTADSPALVAVPPPTPKAS